MKRIAWILVVFICTKSIAQSDKLFKFNTDVDLDTWETEIEKDKLFYLHSIFGNTGYLFSQKSAENYTYSLPQYTLKKLKSKSILGGKAKMVLYQLTFKLAANNKDAMSVDVMLIHPNDSKKHPLIVQLNYYGNQSIVEDKDVPITKGWVNWKKNGEWGTHNNRASEETRGVRVYRWPFERIIEKGYAVVTSPYGEWAPDRLSHFKQAFQINDSTVAKNNFGSIAIWALGMRVIAHSLSHEKSINKEKIIAMGHSRLGRAALWATAMDSVFSGVISNSSCKIGTEPIFYNNGKRDFNYTVNHFPQWWAPRIKDLLKDTALVEIEQNHLLRIIAPRPIYIGTSENDEYADWRGDLLTLRKTIPAYTYYTKEKYLLPDPQINKPIFTHDFGFHVRTGVHDLKEFDWEHSLNFFNQFWAKK